MRRPLAGFAAGALLFGSTFVAAQESVPIVGNSGLRTTSDLDLSSTVRAGKGAAVAAPFSVKPDQTPSEPSARLDGGAADAEDERDENERDENESEDAKPEPRKPKIDLFAEPPAAARATPENDAAGASEPATASGSANPRSKDDLGKKETRRTRVHQGTADEGPLSNGDPTAMPGSSVDATGIEDRSRLSLPSEPARSSRTEALDGRRALRATPLRGTRPLAVAEDPFAPIGLRLGSMILTAALDQSVGYSSNLDRTANGADGAFTDTTLSTRFVSDWSRHQAEINALANYRRNFGGENESNPDVAIDGRLRLDVDRLTTANLRGGFVYRKEDDTDLDATPEIDAEGTKPDILNYSFGGDVERRFGGAFVRGSVSAIRETKEGSELPNTLDENFNTYTAGLRASYELSPSFAPFVEGSAGRRIFDDARGSLGPERDSTIPALRGGVTFDFGEKLNGEIAAGFAWNVPDADAIATAASPTIDAKLNWSPRRGTDLALTATTTFDPDATGVTTSTLYQIGLAARHRATARLDFDASLLGGYRDSDLASETQRTWGASLGFTYWVSRSLAFIGLATHDDVDRLHSPGDYAVDTVKLGLRVQN